MTSVFLESGGGTFSVRCRNHAGSVATCAAISTLCYTLAGYLRSIDASLLEEKLDDGNVSIRFSGTSEAARGAFDMIAIGFLQLAGSYPEDCSVVIQENDEIKLPDFERN